MIFAHIPIGYIESKIIPKEKRSFWKIFAIIVGNFLPDLDFSIVILGAFFGKTFQHRMFITHTPIFWLSIFFISKFFLKFLKISEKKKKTILEIFQILLIGVFSHLFFDSIFTNIGIRWLFPFSNQLFEFPLKSDSLLNVDWTKNYFATLFRLELVFVFIFFVIFFFDILSCYKSNFCFFFKSKKLKK